MMNKREIQEFEEGYNQWLNEFHILEIDVNDLEDMFLEHVKSQGDDGNVQ